MLAHLEHIRLNFNLVFHHILEPEEKRTEDSDGDANQTAELCDADTVESSLPPDSRQKRLADLQAERAACDPTRLQTLKVQQK